MVLLPDSLSADRRQTHRRERLRIRGPNGAVHQKENPGTVRCRGLLDQRRALRTSRTGAVAGACSASSLAFSGRATSLPSTGRKRS